jgi:hypothetical protein
MPMYARAVLPDAHIEVVEIDAMIVEVAQRHFGFRLDSRLVVHTGDGRAFIEEAPPGSDDLIGLARWVDLGFDLAELVAAGYRTPSRPTAVVLTDRHFEKSTGAAAPLCCAAVRE